MISRRTSVGLAILMSGAVAFSAGCGAERNDEGQTEDALLGLSERDVEAARDSGDPKRIAGVLHTLSADRNPLFKGRIRFAQSLFRGLSVAQTREVRAAYIAAHDKDPEITLRSDDLGQPIARLSRSDELEMLAALNGATMAADAATLAGMLDRARTSSLTPADRKAYFAMLPRMGLWDAPVRSARGDRELDALERTLLARAWSARGQSDLDAALATLESKLPAPTLAATADRSKSVAVVASSHGAQWQELMGWAKGMIQRGYKLQLFTPAGRPAAFQRDSLSVSAKTVPLGFGCPLELDPAGETGTLAAELLGNAVSAARFEAKDFGAVYLAGGLGFNEDVAFGEDGRRPDGSRGTVLTSAPSISQMMQKAIGERLPIIALCHGPTLLAATTVIVGGKPEALNKGIATASLPPFEGFVGFTGRKEIQFTYDVNTHAALQFVGGKTDVLKDIANMSRIVKAERLLDGGSIDIITGPGPQAAAPLVQPTIDALAKRW